MEVVDYVIEKMLHHEEFVGGNLCKRVELIANENLCKRVREIVSKFGDATNAAKRRFSRFKRSLRCKNVLKMGAATICTNGCFHQRFYNRPTSSRLVTTPSCRRNATTGGRI